MPKRVNCYVINLERNYPTKDLAIMLLKDQLLQAQIQKYRLVKIIHGYGSSGKGGVIKQAALKYLQGQVGFGRILQVCPGENLDVFSVNGRALASLYPLVKQDSDWGRANYGITMVLLK